MVKHIVFFKFKATEDKAERMSAIKRELEKLPASKPLSMTWRAWLRMPTIPHTNAS